MSLTLLEPSPLTLSNRRGAPEPPTPLGERLVAAGIITPQELQAGLNEHLVRRTRLGEALLELGFVEEDELLPFLGETMEVPTVRLREGLLDPVAVKLIPKAIAVRYQALAMFRV